MNILFISNYKNVGGWSDSAVLHMRELVRLGHQITARHVNLGQGLREVPDIDQLQTELTSYDACIQSVLPGLTHCDRRIPNNIICYYTESDRIPYNWKNKINSFDKAIVSCKESKRISEESGVKIPIYVNPIPVKVPPKVTPEPIKRNPNSCLFYTVADCNPRKNLAALLTAFHSEFHPGENVELCIKVSEPAEHASKILNEMSQGIKSGLRLYGDKHIKETLIFGYINEFQMASLHAAGDVFVNTSFGEAFSIPTIEAGLVGNRCVVPKHSAFLDYFNNNNSFLVESNLVPCFGANAPRGLHEGDQNWWEVNMVDLKNQMRQAYISWSKQNNRVCQTIKEDLSKIKSRWSEILV